MKRWNNNALECESCTFNTNMQKKTLKVFKALVWYIMIVGWKTCDL
jgi:hypothetical protein